MDDLILIAGPCVIENKELALEIGTTVQEICKKFEIRYIFKASYKKANRTKIDSFTGIGDEDALAIIKEVKDKLSVETITDVHDAGEATNAARSVDHLQIPAYLSRQTALLVAAGETGCGINIKKGQFLSPESIAFALEKVRSTGNTQIWLCERGTTFGYNDLIVDATSITRMKKHGVPVIMDCTHAVQEPNLSSGVTAGDATLIKALALSAIATGADGLFIETHPEPLKSPSDAESMLPIKALEPILEQVMKIRDALKT